MPYIKQEDRDCLDETMSELNYKIINEGELNYVITSLCIDYVNRNGKDYSTLNAVHGVLNCADKEFYRRMTAPYEDRKIEENGDVYGN